MKMKRTAFVAMAAFVVTMASAQVATSTQVWQTRHDAIEKRVSEIGKQYEELAMKYPLMFSNYIPTNEETTLDKSDT